MANETTNTMPTKIRKPSITAAIPNIPGLIKTYIAKGTVHEAVPATEANKYFFNNPCIETMSDITAKTNREKSNSTETMNRK